MSKITVGFTKIADFVTAVLFIRTVTYLLGKQSWIDILNIYMWRYIHRCISSVIVTSNKVSAEQ